MSEPEQRQTQRFQGRRLRRISLTMRRAVSRRRVGQPPLWSAEGGRGCGLSLRNQYRCRPGLASPFSLSLSLSPPTRNPADTRHEFFFLSSPTPLPPPHLLSALVAASFPSICPLPSLCPHILSSAADLCRATKRSFFFPFSLLESLTQLESHCCPKTEDTLTNN